MKKHELTTTRSIIREIEDLLTQQVGKEALASSRYLAMGAWAEGRGYDGAAHFLYKHAEEERAHMMRIFRYINEAGGQALAPTLEAVPAEFNSLHQAFTTVLEHELEISRSINAIVAVCLACGDYTTYQFLTWFLTEQREEEVLARKALGIFDKVGDTPTALHFIDKQLGKLHAE